MSHGPYQKKYLVSPADMEQLVEQYKGTLMENSRLTHAARLAAKQHVLLASPEIPPATQAENPAQDTHLVAVTGRRLGRRIGGAHPQHLQEQDDADLEQKQVASGRTLQRADPAHQQETTLSL